MRSCEQRSQLCDWLLIRVSTYYPGHGRSSGIPRQKATNAHGWA
jgi:hypothetical protein